MITKIICIFIAGIIATTTTSRLAFAAALGDGLPPGMTYMYPEWYGGSADATLPTALKNQLIRYSIVTDLTEVTTDDLRFDFEVALRVWLIALGFHDVHIDEAPSLDRADLVLSFSENTLHSSGHRDGGVAASFLTSLYRVRKDKILPVVELHPSPKWPWTSLRTALQNDGRVYVAGDKPENDHYTPLARYTGELLDVETVAREILRSKPIIYDGRSVWIEQKRSQLLFATILHELGHAFGLNDLYAYNEPMEDLARYDSIMGNSKFKPMFPSLVDRRMARVHILQYRSRCQRLLLRDLVDM